MVLWRPWARSFWAFPCWITDDPRPVEARRAGDLLSLMAETEAADAAHRREPTG
ncbi:hypothetical protein [Streptosporangium pseudovulgare]|uniref:hypothetical protein n=1 Tax=Streptosporangium pseudovulgare TaxID=35765 RepID=UPI001670B9EB|nr:hypothetical protein [Streptosporangium pseudovulgare]